MSILIPTNVHIGYVSDWTMVEAVRELIQNAIDATTGLSGKFNISYSKNQQRLHVVTESILPLSALYMGKTYKGNDDSTLGKHGEGLKLAMLVLARECRQPLIRSDKLISTEFIDTLAGDEVLQIMQFKIDENPSLTEAKKTIISFKIAEEELELIQGVYLNNRKPRILKEGSGKLYVGGLAIADSTFKHSYNLDPRDISLERDRRVASLEQTQRAIMNLWIKSRKWSTIATGVIEGISDFDGILDAELPEEFYTELRKQLNQLGTIPVGYSEYLKAESKPGMFTVNWNTRELTRRMGYKDIPAKPSIKSLLRSWINEFHTQLNDEAYNELVKILDEKYERPQEIKV